VNVRKSRLLFLLVAATELSLRVLHAQFVGGTTAGVDARLDQWTAIWGNTTPA